MSLCLIVVLGQSVWTELESLDDPELRVLADYLPDTVLQSRDPSTVRKYTGAFLRWKKWATNKPGVAALPFTLHCTCAEGCYCSTDGGSSECSVLGPLGRCGG